MVSMVRLARIWPWIPLAVGAAATVAAVGAYWGLSEDLLNRSLIVLASAWLLYRSRAAIVAGTADGSSRAVGYANLAVGLLMIPPGWFLLIQVGPRPVVLWWLAIGMLASTVGTVLIQNGWRSLRAIAFALLFVLFALPTPQRIEGPVQEFLQEWTTTFSAAALRGLGYACERHGFVLSLPGGKLGVVEACSGIRSVTALTAVAALLAYWRGMGFVRGSFFVALGIPIIIAANVGRITLTGVLQESAGRSAIHGTAHDLLGFSVILIGLAALVGLALFFSKRLPRPTEMPEPLSAGARDSRLAVALGTATLVLSVAAVGLALALDDRPARPAPLEQIATNLADWRGEDAVILGEIRDTLGYDRILHRVYRNAIGQEIHVWVIFWSRATSEKGYHHPDLCLGNQGWSVVERRIVDVSIGDGDALPVTFRRFRHDDQAQAVCYWTQEGSRVWTDEDEEAARAGGSHRWLDDVRSGQLPKQDARVSVLIGTELWGSNRYLEEALLSFCRLFAAELYRVMPWARPSTKTE
jgi:EpsI family protein